MDFCVRKIARIRLRTCSHGDLVVLAPYDLHRWHAGASFSLATNGDGPRISLALWDDAVVVNKVWAAMVARPLRAVG